MTETKTCPSCGAAAPVAAAFCTSCGQPMPEAQPPAAPPWPLTPDDTRVDTIGLHDATQVHEPYAPPPAQVNDIPAIPPPVAPDPVAAPGSTPWSTAPSNAVPPGPPTTAPWNPPPNPPPPTWQNSVPPPTAATFGAAASPQPQWGAPGAVPPPGAWGPAPDAAAKAPSRSPLGGIAAFAGGILTVVGVFSGWVTLDPGGNSETVTAWSLTAGDGLLKSTDPYLLVALGVVAILLGALLFTGVARTLVRLAAIATGLGIVATAALNWVSIAGFVTDNLPSSFTAKTAIGFYLALAGGVVTAISGLLPAKK